MNAYCDQACLQEDASADIGFEHGFKGANLAFGTGDLSKEFGRCFGMADVVDGGLRSKGCEPAEDQHFLA